MSPVHKELKEAQTRLVGRLRSEYGIVAHRVNLRGFYHSFRMWNSKMDNEEVREGVPGFNNYFRHSLFSDTISGAAISHQGVGSGGIGPAQFAP